MVNLLCFSDLHCSKSAAEKLVVMADSADILIGAGDFANARRGLPITIDILKSVNKPTILVPGNSEAETELSTAIRGWSSATVLHGTGTEILGIPFFGIGGGIPVTPFGAWSYDFTETEARQLLKNCPEDGVLVSHSPPKGVVDISSQGRSLGSVAVREAIEQRHPQLVVCGHIHACAGQSGVIGRTKILNAGPEGILVTL